MERESRVEGPQGAVLLIGEEEVGFSANCAERRSDGVMRAVGGSCAKGDVGNGLDADVGGVKFSASMLDEDLNGRFPANAFLCVWTIPADGAVESYGKGFLMGVEVEDVALPVYPHVEVQTGTFPQELESHFRIGGQILFRIVKRENELVVLCSVDVSEYESNIAEVGLSSEPR